MTARIAYFVFFAPERKKTWRPSLKAAREKVNLLIMCLDILGFCAFIGSEFVLSYGFFAFLAVKCCHCNSPLLGKHGRHLHLLKHG